MATSTKHLTDSAHVDGRALELAHQQAKQADLELSHKLALDILADLGVEA